MMGEEEFELLELQDQANEIGKLTPREYARLHNMAPQNVYYYLRQGDLQIETCICGRKVIDVKKADEHFEQVKRRKAK